MVVDFYGKLIKFGNVDVMGVQKRVHSFATTLYVSTKIWCFSLTSGKICLILFHHYPVTLQVKAHQNNSPLELLILKPYYNSGLFQETIYLLVFGLPVWNSKTIERIAPWIVHQTNHYFNSTKISSFRKFRRPFHFKMDGFFTKRTF